MSSRRRDEAVVGLGDSRAVARAVWHALFWLTVANAIGVLIAVLLVVPSLNSMLGELTYGRWVMVHMNFELYGWTALPLVGFLFRIYKADIGAMSRWCRPLLWAWSAALVIGATSWLSGHSTGKLFLDWSGYSLSFLVCMLLALWFLLVCASVVNRDVFKKRSLSFKAALYAGLAALPLVPFALYLAATKGSYPAVNPATGGPTAASQLESSLAVVLVLLIVPFGIAPRAGASRRPIALSWLALLAEGILCLSMGRADVSYRIPTQFMSLGCLPIWIPLIPSYYECFVWAAGTRRWKIASQFWWVILVVTGWISFLPGVLDHLKFTDGLVAHSFVAMAGFTSSFIIFLMVQLLGTDGWIFGRTRSFYLWHGSVIAYVVLMAVAGWREGSDPAFTIVPGIFRDILYSLRLVSGILMLIASFDWLADCSALLRKPVAVREGMELAGVSR